MQFTVYSQHLHKLLNPFKKVKTEIPDTISPKKSTLTSYGGIIRIRFEGIISAYNEAPLFCLFFGCKGNKNILQREKLF